MTSKAAQHVNEETWLLEQRHHNIGDVEKGTGIIQKQDSSSSDDDDEDCVSDLLHRLKIGAYFALWYALNIVYNILNKQVLNVLPAPLMVGCFQFGVGAAYVGMLWLFSWRERPHLSALGLWSMYYYIGLFHCLGQLCTMVSLGAAPVSFTHIVKALEPFFSALVSTFLLRKYMSLSVYATLIPVVGGVLYACWKETSFSWLAFGTAMASNLAFSLRAVLSKMAMSSSSKQATLTNKSTAESDSDDDDDDDSTSKEVEEETLSPVNVFGLITCLAFLLSIPIALMVEGSSFLTVWRTAVIMSSSSSSLSTDSTSSSLETLSSSSSSISWEGEDLFSIPSLHLIWAIVLSGFFHYMNNEVMYLALENVHPVTLAVGNTMKRAFILVASVIFFHTTMSLQAMLGSAIGIGGVLLYSLTIHYHEHHHRHHHHESKKTTTDSTTKKLTELKSQCTLEVPPQVTKQDVK